MCKIWRVRQAPPAFPCDVNIGFPSLSKRLSPAAAILGRGPPEPKVARSTLEPLLPLCQAARYLDNATSGHLPGSAGVSPLRGVGVFHDSASLRSRVRDNASRFVPLPDARRKDLRTVIVCPRAPALKKRKPIPSRPTARKEQECRARAPEGKPTPRGTPPSGSGSGSKAPQGKNNLSGPTALAIGRGRGPFYAASRLRAALGTPTDGEGDGDEAKSEGGRCKPLGLPLESWIDVQLPSA